MEIGQSNGLELSELTNLFSIVLETEPYHKFRIRVKTEGVEGEGEGDGTPASAEISLTFQYTASYPDQPPALEVAAVDNVEDQDLDELRQRLDEEVGEAEIGWSHRSESKAVKGA